MTTTRTSVAIAFAIALPFFAACEDKPSSPAASTASTASPASPASTAAAGSPKPSATTADAPPDEAPAKKYDCGAKGQKPCPMQGWMKRVMAPASAASDADGLAKAMAYVADHPPPGFTEWTGLAKTAGAKAKAGDVDGAKASCKACHDLYKNKYKATMRDRAF